MKQYPHKLTDDFEIPVHKIKDFAPNGVSARLYCEDMNIASWEMIEKFPIHRDDHYFFLVLEEGCGSLDVDFQTIELHSNQLYVVTPGQLHGNVDARGSRGWVVLVAPEYIDTYYRELFAKNMFRVEPHSLSYEEKNLFSSVLDLMVRLQNREQELFYSEVMRSTAELFIALVARALKSSEIEAGIPDTNKRRLAYKFKELIREHFRYEKSVQFYAAKLNVTSGYLNEVLNNITGQSTTYWILEEILLEAKRLLIVSDLTVKEIGYALGYENYTYFNRMFHKRTGMTPLQFRIENRK